LFSAKPKRGGAEHQRATCTSLPQRGATDVSRACRRPRALPASPHEHLRSFTFEEHAELLDLRQRRSDDDLALANHAKRFARRRRCSFSHDTDRAQRPGSERHNGECPEPFGEDESFTHVVGNLVAVPFVPAPTTLAAKAIARPQAKRRNARTPVLGSDRAATR